MLRHLRRLCCHRLVGNAVIMSRWMTSQESKKPRPLATPPCPVSSYNEWDPLEEVIVGRPEGAIVPRLSPDLKAKLVCGDWDYIRNNTGKLDNVRYLRDAMKEVEEFCRILELEGVTVRRPEAIQWEELGMLRTPYFEDTGGINSSPRDGQLVVGNEIIDASMTWRSRCFDHIVYRKLLFEYFQRGARLTSIPKPTLNDELFTQDYPFEDEAEREKWVSEGRFILTESEPVFDAADCIRFGRDIFMTICHTTNRGGVEWLRRHLEPRGIRVHSLIHKGIYTYHADTTFIPLRPGLLLVNPVEPCLKIDDEPIGWEYFTKRGWKVVEAPDPVITFDSVYVPKSIHMNLLSLDTERVFVQRGEVPLIRLLVSLGLKPIEVDIRNFNPIGGGFHCSTLDIRRRGGLDTYL